MNKKYTYGVAALVLTGTTLIGSSLYAADILPKISTSFTSIGKHHAHKGSENILASLSGSVSQAALSELETALKNVPGHGMATGGGRHGGMQDILAALPADVTTKIQDIHTAYETKVTALKDQERAEVLAQLEAYPDAKKAYQEMIQNKANGMERGGKGKGGKRGGHGGEGRGGFGMK